MFRRSVRNFNRWPLAWDKNQAEYYPDHGDFDFKENVGAKD